MDMDIDMEVISLEEFMDIVNKLDIMYISRDEESSIITYRYTKNAESNANIIAFKAGTLYYKFIKG